MYNNFVLVENIKEGKVFSLIRRRYQKNSTHRVVSARRQNYHLCPLLPSEDGFSFLFHGSENLTFKNYTPHIIVYSYSFVFCPS